MPPLPVSHPCQSLGELNGVEVTGEVPDVEPHLSSGSVYACPMVSGTGIKNKLLEAMANGLPCVASPLAAQGLSVQDGVELQLAAPENFARRLIELLRDEGRASALGRAAQDYALGHHSWGAAAARYVEVYGELTASSRPSPK